MSWASILLALIKAVGALATYLHDNKLISAGQSIEAASALKAQHDALNKANAVREAVRADLARHPDKRLSDDGFRRD
jgi:hypothetical protein